MLKIVGIPELLTLTIVLSSRLVYYIAMYSLLYKISIEGTIALATRIASIYYS